MRARAEEHAGDNARHGRFFRCFDFLCALRRPQLRLDREPELVYGIEQRLHRGDPRAPHRVLIRRDRRRCARFSAVRSSAESAPNTGARLFGEPRRQRATVCAGLRHARRRDAVYGLHPEPRFSRAGSNAATRARTLPACSASLRAASSGPNTPACSARPSAPGAARPRSARVNSGIAYPPMPAEPALRSGIGRIAIVTGEFAIGQRRAFTRARFEPEHEILQALRRETGARQIRFAAMAASIAAGSPSTSTSASMRG